MLKPSGVLAAVTAALTLACTHAASAQAAAVDNSTVTYDTAGARLDAHDGTIIQTPDGTMWLYGTSYGCGYRWGAPSTWCGVRVYQTRDLKTWTPAGAVNGFAFDGRTADWQARCAYPAYGCFRPHVVRRPDGGYIMWINGAGGYLVLGSNSPRGPFTLWGKAKLTVTPPAGERVVGWGDEDVFRDSLTGYFYAAVTVVTDKVVLGTSGRRHALAVARLDPTAKTGWGPSVWVGGSLVEAPGMFMTRGWYYLAYSDPACPYCSGTGTSYVRARSPLGPWSTGTRISSDSCGGQPADVNALLSPTAGRRLVWQTDRWVRNATGTSFDPNQYGANNYLAPLAFRADATIPPQPCVRTWSF